MHKQPPQATTSNWCNCAHLDIHGFLLGPPLAFCHCHFNDAIVEAKEMVMLIPENRREGISSRGDGCKSTGFFLMFLLLFQASNNDIIGKW